VIQTAAGSSRADFIRSIAKPNVASHRRAGAGKGPFHRVAQIVGRNRHGILTPQSGINAAIATACKAANHRRWALSEFRRGDAKVIASTGSPPKCKQPRSSAQRRQPVSRPLQEPGRDRGP